MAGTPHNPSYTPSPPISSNTAGLVGFLLTLLTCGFLSPLGLIFSLIGLRKAPRIMAVLGTVLGMLGVIGYLVSFMMMYGLARGGAYVISDLKVSEGVARIKQYREQNNGQLPDDIEGIKLVQDIKDGYDTPLRYEKTGNTFKIRSAGRDKVWDTEDDILSKDFENDAPLELDVGIGDGAMDGPVIIPEDGSAPEVNLPTDETPKPETPAEETPKEDAPKEDAEKEADE